MPSFKQTFWKIWYQYISHRIGSDTVTFLNYGFWPPEAKPLHSSLKMKQIDRRSSFITMW